MRLRNVGQAIAGIVTVALAVTGCSETGSTSSSTSAGGSAAAASCTKAAPSTVASPAAAASSAAASSAPAASAAASARRLWRSRRTGREGPRRVAHHRRQVRSAWPRAEGAGRHDVRLRRRGRQVRGRRSSASRNPASTWKETPSAERETALTEPGGRLHRRDLLDHRQPQEGRRLRRPVLHRPSGPAGQVRQHRHLRPERPERQAALLGQGLHLGAEDQGHLRRRRAAQGVRQLLRLRRRR